MVVTGDPTQSDLEDARKSGLVDAVRRLRGFAGVGVVEFASADIVRHPLVEQIVRAYEAPAAAAEAMSRAAPSRWTAAAGAAAAPDDEREVRARPSQRGPRARRPPGPRALAWCSSTTPSSRELHGRWLGDPTPDRRDQPSTSGTAAAGPAASSTSASSAPAPWPRARGLAAGARARAVRRARRAAPVRPRRPRGAASARACAPPKRSVLAALGYPADPGRRRATRSDGTGRLRDDSEKRFFLARPRRATPRVAHGADRATFARRSSADCDLRTDAPRARGRVRPRTVAPRGAARGGLS